MGFFAYNPFKSLTIWGVIPVVATMLVQAFDPGALSPAATTALQAMGVMVTALGLRNAHAKTVQQVAEMVSQLAAKR